MAANRLKKCSTGITLELGGEEIDCRITGTYVPGTREVRYLRNGDPGHPAEPAEVEVESVTREDTGADVLGMLTEKQTEAVYDALLDKGAECDEDPDPDFLHDASRDDRLTEV